MKRQSWYIPSEWLWVIIFAAVFAVLSVIKFSGLELKVKGTAQTSVDTYGPQTRHHWQWGQK